MDPETVERLRVAKGFRYQADLAERAGVDQGTISKMERRPGPYELATVERVARALGVEIEALLQPHEDEIADDDARILLTAILGVVRRPMTAAERRKIERALTGALKLFREGQGGDGTVKPYTHNRTGVGLSGSRNQGRPIAAGAG